MNNFKTQLVLLLELITSNTTAQIGLSTRTSHIEALLGVVAKNKCIIFPRLALTATESATSLSAHDEGITVYYTYNNSNNKSVFPGYLYNDGSKWAKIATSEGKQGIQGVAGGK